MARITRKPPTAAANNNKSATASSATGETHARQPNQATTKVPNASTQPWVAPARRRQHPGTAANTAKPRASSAGPHIQQSNPAPSNTASQIETTRKIDAITVMIVNLQHPTSNIQHSTFNIQHPTSNIQHPTFNIQHSTFYILLRPPPEQDRWNG
jgi:hypothetical protein